MLKITFMGAGSTVFVRNVIGDCLCTPSLREAEIALYDIDPERLEDSRIILEALNRNVNESRAVIKTYLGAENRKEALRGARFVINAIQVGGYDPCTITDFEIPKKYGLRQTIADTLGIGGIMRALRTIPVMEEFARDMEEVCPDCIFLNYTNPMAMLSGYMQRYTSVKTVGLCHSVQVCSSTLLEELDMKEKLEGRTELIAGINHMAWLLEIRDRDGPRRAEGLLKQLVRPEGKGVVHLELGHFAAPPVRQRDLYMAPVVQPPGLIRDAKVRHMDLCPVIEKDRLSWHTVAVDHRRCIEGERAENNRQQNGQVRDKGSVAPDPVLAVDCRAVHDFALAAHGVQILPQLLNALGCEPDGDGQLRRTLRLALCGLHYAPDAQQGTEAEIEAEQREQDNKVPALEHTVEPEQQDHAVKGAIGLRVPGDLPPLGDYGARHGAGRDQPEQQQTETHGAQVVEYFFHGQPP